MQKTISLILACLASILFCGIDARADVIAPELQGIMKTLKPGEEIAVIVSLADQVDLKSFKDKDKALRRTRIIKALQDKAEKTQKYIKKYLKQSKVKKVKSFWIFNGLAVTADAKVIQKMAGMAGIESIRPDSTLTLEEPRISVNAGVPEWNIAAINAPELWSLGYTGTGTVLAIMDTGVDMTHPDLATRWRGGSNSWFDPYYDPNVADPPPDHPYDTNGHGTNVMGIMVGGDAGGSSIGVAPGAQWIAAKIFNDAVPPQATLTAIHDGFEWLLDPDGDPETDDAPDVVNNSWTFPDLAGSCLFELPYFQADILALKAVEIGVVFSGGNGGPSPGTSESPANNQGSFAVGAVDTSRTIAYFSSRGPSACDGGIYPEVVAPGVSIRTADLGGGYYNFALGTSMAAPHVAGAVGLLLSAYPTLSISEIEAALTEAAQDLGEPGPDNTYGYGLLDVMATFNLIAANHAPLPPVAHNDIFTIPRNAPTVIIDILDILANDVATDAPIDATSLVLRSPLSARGNFVAVNVDNTITYSPEGGGGPDYFWYTVNDTGGMPSNEATVRINRVRAAEPAPSSSEAAVPHRARNQ